MVTLFSFLRNLRAVLCLMAAPISIHTDSAGGLPSLPALEGTVLIIPELSCSLPVTRKTSLKFGESTELRLPDKQSPRWWDAYAKATWEVCEDG